MSEAGGSDVPDDERDLAKHDDQAPSVADAPDKNRILELLASFTSISSSAPMHHPIFAKFEAEHVTKFLDHAHKHDIEDSRFRSGGRWFRLVYVLIGVVIFVFLTLFLLPDQSVLYFEILKGIGIFGAGVAGG